MKPHTIRRHLPGLLLLLGSLLTATGATAQTTVLDVKDSGGATLMQVNDDAGLLGKGVFGTGTIPVTGAGVRLMWYPGKAAFRAGSVDDAQWNDDNVGPYSVAMGIGTTARGSVSVAMGGFTTASGDLSTAMGWNTTASGDYSTAMGYVTTAQAYASLVLGQYNFIAGSSVGWVATDPVLVVGNGSSGSTSDAFTLLKNGNLTIAGTLTQSSDRRLKTDIHPLTDALAGLARLQPVRYRFREGTNRPEGVHIGLIAQGVEAVFPELVSQGADGYLSVSYANLSAVLVQALHEQQDEIETLNARLVRLEAALLRSSAGPVSATTARR